MFGSYGIVHVKWLSVVKPAHMLTNLQAIYVLCLSNTYMHQASAVLLSHIHSYSAIGSTLYIIIGNSTFPAFSRFDLHRLRPTAPDLAKGVI